MVKSGIMLAAMLMVVAIGTAGALQCLKCGQYNDGVGSITPCINYTHMQLIDCPSKNHAYCIKYISEGSTVRDCVADCTEKDNWSAKTFCCKEDGCNASPRGMEPSGILCVTIIALITAFTTMIPHTVAH